MCVCDWVMCVYVCLCASENCLGNMDHGGAWIMCVPLRVGRGACVPLRVGHGSRVPLRVGHGSRVPLRVGHGSCVPLRVGRGSCVYL